MSVLRALRQLLFGETWTLPLGVAVVLLIGVAVRAGAPDLWPDIGGFVLLAGILAALLMSIREGRS